ncbi:ferredoxin [Streptomyces sp. NPDC001617]
MSLRVEADDEVCIASGQCSELAPTVFGRDDLGIVRVLTESPTLDVETAARHAARICPAAAIRIREAPNVE